MIDYENQQARRRVITRWLQLRTSLSVAEITARLAVSRMTIHRDIAYLVREGIAAKRHGWVEWIDRQPRETRSAARQGLSERTRCDVLLPNGQRRSVCCPSCGLRYAATFGDDTRLEVNDTLNGIRLDGRQATYVVGSRVNLCCRPSVLAFEDSTDAASFQRGFGGQVATFASALALFMAEPVATGNARTVDIVATRRGTAQHLAHQG